PTGRSGSPIPPMASSGPTRGTPARRSTGTGTCSASIRPTVRCAPSSSTWRPPTGSPSPRTSRCCTSRTPRSLRPTVTARTLPGPAGTRSTPTTSARVGTPSTAGRWWRWVLACPTVSAWTRTGASGPPPSPASRCAPRAGRSSARSRCRRRWPTAASAGPTGARCTSVRAPASTGSAPAPGTPQRAGPGSDRPRAPGSARPVLLLEPLREGHLSDDGAGGVAAQRTGGEPAPVGAGEARLEHAPGGPVVRVLPADHLRERELVGADEVRCTAGRPGLGHLDEVLAHLARGDGPGQQTRRDRERAEGRAGADLPGELVELGRPRDRVRDGGVPDGLLLGELAGVVRGVDPVDADDREHAVVGHAVACPGLEEVTARGAEELGRLPARERCGVQRIDHCIDAHQTLLEPGTGEHVGALAAGEDHDVVPLRLRGPDRVPSYHSGAAGDRDLHRCSSRDAPHRRPGAARRQGRQSAASRKIVSISWSSGHSCLTRP